MSNDLSARNHASARGGHRANTGLFALNIPPVDPLLLKCVAQMKKTMRETGESATTVLDFSRKIGAVVCTEQEAKQLIILLSK